MVSRETGASFFIHAGKGTRSGNAFQWVAGARLRTLPIVIAPVVIGTAAAVGQTGQVSWFRFVLALLVGLLLQVGVNYSNDYSDGIRGTDDERVGPVRLTGCQASHSHTGTKCRFWVLRARRDLRPAASNTFLNLATALSRCGRDFRRIR